MLRLYNPRFPLPPSPFPHHPITPSPHHPITPFPHHPITPSPLKSWLEP
ncbi:MAG: hypothetical protein ACOC2Z_07155 [Coleofasciculus sp.]